MKIRPANYNFIQGGELRFEMSEPGLVRLKDNKVIIQQIPVQTKG